MTRSSEPESDGPGTRRQPGGAAPSGAAEEPVGDGVAEASASPESDGDDSPPASLAEDLEAFLTAFAQALQKWGMYPPGHPALEPVAGRLGEALADATASREEIVIVVGPHSLELEGAETSPDHRHFHSLARRLYGHHLAALTIRGGADREEISRFLTALARSTDEDETGEDEREPLGLRHTGGRIPGCPHVRLEPMPYDALQVSELEGGLGAAEAESLWLGLSRAALGIGEDEERGEEAADPEAVAAAIREELSDGEDAAYAERVVERLREAASRFRGTRRRAEGGGSPMAGLSDRMTELVTALPPDALADLLESGASPEEARQFLFDVSYQMEPEGIQALLAVAGDAKFLQISGFLNRVFRKLAHHAREEHEATRESADREMREHVREMLARWELDSPNPDDYEQSLQRMMAGVEMRDGRAGLVLAEVEPLRFVQEALELEEGTEAARYAAREVEGPEDRLDLLRCLNDTPEGGRVADAVWEEIAGPDWIRDLLEAGPEDLEALDPVIARSGPAAAGALLDALAGSDSRSARRYLFDRLTTLGPGVGPEVVRRLERARREPDRYDWFVRRNLLGILSELPSPPEGFDPRAFLDDPHPEVRYEAVALAVRRHDTRAAGILAALDDDHSRTVIRGLSAAREACPPEAMPRLLEAARDPDLSWEIRVHALRALERTASDDALEALLDLVTRRQRPFFWRRTLRDPSPEMLEALRALAVGWPDHPRVRAILDEASASDDPSLREAASAEGAGAKPGAAEEER